MVSFTSLIKPNKLVDMNRMSVFMRANNLSNFSLNKDYLNFSYDISVEEMLGKMGEESPNGQCLSDILYVITSAGKRKKKRLLITPKSIFILNASGKAKVQRRSSFESLKEVVISAKNFTLAVLVFSEGMNLMIDTYRRLDIITYISQIMKRNFPQKPFRIVYLKKESKRGNNFSKKKKSKTISTKNGNRLTSGQSVNEDDIDIESVFEHTRRNSDIKLNFGKLKK